MAPWDGTTFKRHNAKATKAQLRAGAAEANRVLRKTGDEDKAVRAGNTKIKYMRRGK